MVTADQLTAALDVFIAREAKTVSAPPDAVPGFVHGDGIAEFIQFIGGAETGETRTDDDDAAVRRLEEGSALKRREVFEESFSLCIERSVTGVAVGWRPLAFVSRDGRGMAMRSAQNGI